MSGKGRNKNYIFGILFKDIVVVKLFPWHQRDTKLNSEAKEVYGIGKLVGRRTGRRRGILNRYNI